jgi:methylphosphotriester-DNA--protein-cysteine methyltransferase
MSTAVVIVQWKSPSAASFAPVWRDLATRYLREPAIAIAEVAFLLGFSEASAFHRRWLGTTPAAYRARQREGR